jgi:hypothetical protein
MALAPELDELVAVEEQVGGLLSVAPGEHHRGRAERMHFPDQLLRGDVLARAGQRPRLRDVGSDDGRARDEQRPERVLGVLVEKPHTALGDHHRVEHDRRVRDEFERPADSLDGRRRAEHADLHGIHADVLGDRANLLDNDLAGDGVNSGDGDRVLRGDRGDGRHPVNAAPRERLEIGLDAGPTTGVGAGDGEHAREAVGSHGQRRIGAVTEKSRPRAHS